MPTAPRTRGKSRAQHNKAWLVNNARGEQVHGPFYMPLASRWRGCASGLARAPDAYVAPGARCFATWPLQVLDGSAPFVQSSRPLIRRIRKFPDGSISAAHTTRGGQWPRRGDRLATWNGLEVAPVVTQRLVVALALCWPGQAWCTPFLNNSCHACPGFMTRSIKNFPLRWCRSV